MMKPKIKTKDMLLLAITIMLCLLVSFTATLSWFNFYNPSLIVQVGDINFDVTFYRMREANWDGVYNYDDFLADAIAITTLDDDETISEEDFAAFRAALSTAYFNSTETSLDFDNGEQVNNALALLPESTRLKYTYTTDFSIMVNDVAMNSIISFKLRIENTSDRVATAHLSFSDLMKYYYNRTQIVNYATVGEIETAIESGNDKELDIKNFAAKFLFSLERDIEVEGENGTEMAVESQPLWQLGQREEYTAVRIGANTTEDIDFRIVCDAKSNMQDYLNSIVDPSSNCFKRCKEIASQSVLGGATDAELNIFVDSYIKAVNAAEMAYLFTEDGDSAGTSIRLKLEYIQILGRQNT